jgi:hypothetical protein
MAGGSKFKILIISNMVYQHYKMIQKAIKTRDKDNQGLLKYVREG